MIAYKYHLVTHHSGDAASDATAVFSNFPLSEIWLPSWRQNRKASHHCAASKQHFLSVSSAILQFFTVFERITLKLLTQSRLPVRIPNFCYHWAFKKGLLLLMNSPASSMLFGVLVEEIKSTPWGARTLRLVNVQLNLFNKICFIFVVHPQKLTWNLCTLKWTPTRGNYFKKNCFRLFHVRLQKGAYFEGETGIKRLTEPKGRQTWARAHPSGQCKSQASRVNSTESSKRFVCERRPSTLIQALKSTEPNSTIIINYPCMYVSHWFKTPNRWSLHMEYCHRASGYYHSWHPHQEPPFHLPHLQLSSELSTWLASFLGKLHRPNISLNWHRSDLQLQDLEGHLNITKPVDNLENLI